MNTNLLNTLKQIIAMYGETALAEPKRVFALLSDLAKDEPKPPKYALIKALEHGFVKILRNADEADRNECGQSLTQRLHEEEGLDLALCTGTLELLAAVLFGEKKKIPQKVLCKSCGEELQESWKLCPYCGAATKPENTPKVVPQNFTAQPKRPHSSFVQINGGTFLMGSPANEAGRDSYETQHKVTVSGFYMGKYAVTQQEYEEVMGKNPSYFKGDNLPVEQVSWYDTVAYCNKRSQREGLTPAYAINGGTVNWNRSANGYRLPTEAEWEYACRAGTTTPYYTGHSVDNAAWFSDNSEEKTHPVGKRQPNDWGLYDMHGNVWEWCWDWFGDYPSEAQTDPVGASSGSFRVIRGGSWCDSAVFVRSAYRFDASPSFRYYNLGFRLVRS